MTNNNAVEEKKFYGSMTVKEALNLHPDAAMVFSTYHLGGCSHCSINEMETVEQVCSGYGVPVDQLLESLQNLIDD